MRDCRTWLVALGRALRLHCPHCGIGAPLKHLVRVDPVCAFCGLQIYRESGYFIGAIYIGYFLTVGPVMAAIWILPRSGLPLVWELALWVALTILLALLSVPTARSLWIAVDYFLDPWDPDPARAQAPSTAARRSE